ncbi:MAG: Fic family protein [Betaproteobacteria bacterium]|nr:Fic family protein [Betaproteobacteria bacterium]
MRLPQTPPSVNERFFDLLLDVPPEVLESIQATLPDGRYLHWDELRHRTPPVGLTLEQWWLGIKMARRSQFQKLPLQDKAGVPFTFAMPAPVIQGLHVIDRDTAGQILMDAPVAGPQDRDRYLMSSLIEESITSSQLEGASTTRRVAEDMLRQGRRPRDLSERMIFNNHQAMQHLRAVQKEPLTPALILDLHRRLTVDTLDDPADAGRLRQSDDIHVVDPRDGQLLHIPPAAADLPARLEQLCAFANAGDDALPYVHPVVRAILLHFMLGYDHPFVDGNGRCARALFYWAMARQGYWLVEYLSISNVLRQAPGQYARAYLHTETDGNDATYFLLHQLDVIRQAVANLASYLKEKTRESRATARLLEQAALRERCNHRQIALLTHAVKHPDALYTVESHRSSHNTAYATARADLLNLAELGLLRAATQGKRFVFTVPEDLSARLHGRPSS